jgi:peptidoglycan hydrolase-like protein with peptidoglycan-binding domain
LHALPTIDLAFRRLVRVALVLAVLAVPVAVTEAAAGERAARIVREHGVTVKQLQRALEVTADGIYGPQTKRAVRRYQRRNGLTVDGIAGRETLTSLGLIGGGAKAESTREVLERIAQCESGGDPTAVSANGKYFGKYQFSKPTWRSVGGSGNPAKASEAEQDRRARKLYRRAGTSPWPNCA